MADPATLYARLATFPQGLAHLYHDIGFERGSDPDIGRLLTRFATSVARFGPEHWPLKLVERLVVVYADLSDLMRRYLPPSPDAGETETHKEHRLKTAKELLVH